MSYFIVVEGVDGSGKGEVTTRIANLLKSSEYGFNVKVEIEPTESNLGKFIRDAIKTDSLSSRTEALLFAADRQEHSKRMAEKLEEGVIVVCDRYLYSSLVYQPFKGDVDEEWILELNRGVAVPDLLILVKTSYETADKRISKSLRHTVDKKEYFEAESNRKIIHQRFEVFVKEVEQGKYKKEKLFPKKVKVLNNDFDSLDLLEVEIQNFMKKYMRTILKKVTKSVSQADYSRNYEQWSLRPELQSGTEMGSSFESISKGAIIYSREYFESEINLCDFMNECKAYQEKWENRGKPKGLAKYFFSGQMEKLICQSISYYFFHESPPYSAMGLHKLLGKRIGYTEKALVKSILGLKKAGLIKGKGGSGIYPHDFLFKIASFLRYFGSENLVEEISKKV